MIPKNTLKDIDTTCRLNPLSMKIALIERVLYCSIQQKCNVYGQTSNYENFR